MLDTQHFPHILPNSNGMRSPVLFTFLASAAVLIAVVHRLAFQFYLYWEYAWFDIPMHFLGGVVISLLFLVLLLASPSFNRWRSISFGLLFVFVIGILWELFEIVAGISPFEPGFVTDTIIDLCMDLAGGVVGFVVGKRVSEL